MNELIYFAGITLALYLFARFYGFFDRARRFAGDYKQEYESVLNSDENKVKGRHG